MEVNKKEGRKKERDRKGKERREKERKEGERERKVRKERKVLGFQVIVLTELILSYLGLKGPCSANSSIYIQAFVLSLLGLFG